MNAVVTNDPKAVRLSHNRYPFSVICYPNRNPVWTESTLNSSLFVLHSSLDQKFLPVPLWEPPPELVRELPEPPLSDSFTVLEMCE